MSLTLKVQPSQLVNLQDRKITTTSLVIADAFEKQHKNILQSIQSLDCSEDFASANFSAHVQTIEIGNGAKRESKYYEITKDGFMFLVMGFTGTKAAAWKEAFINAFNAMEAELSNQHQDTLTHSEQQTLRELINRKLSHLDDAQRKKAYPQVWERIKNKFRVAKYEQLQRSQLADVIVYLSNMELKGSAKQQPQPISAEQKRMIEQAMINVTRYFKTDGQKAASNIHSMLRKKYGYPKLDAMTTEHLQPAINDLKQIEVLAHQIYIISSSIESQGLHWIISHKPEQVNQLLLTQKTALGMIAA
ncbi:Rha family transcriptional regulator [Thiomicrorhabdus sp.]|uniref:Rha family transcriptional regulator n=1 Tax=Thiomicrorhabdus sp. TaxID=2039724 RepID=UPI0029C7DAF5|nr:Rha family transcriptional regulator [Thiomicrorhabdus sp.]